MIDDKELDKIQEEVQQDIIDARDSIDPNVEQHLSEMGFLWDNTMNALKEDNICFKCKLPLFKEEDTVRQIHLLKLGTKDKGVIAFCSLHQECMEELKKE
jgi:hypothetical protein